MNKLWIFEVSNIAFLETWIGVLKPWSNMICNNHTFLDCYSMFSPLYAYYMPTYENKNVIVLGKLP
jgi:hypothetical protein